MTAVLKTRLLKALSQQFVLCSRNLSRRSNQSQKNSLLLKLYSAKWSNLSCNQMDSIIDEIEQSGTIPKSTHTIMVNIQDQAETLKNLNLTENLVQKMIQKTFDKNFKIDFDGHFCGWNNPSNHQNNKVSNSR
jgi:hypothetical protein